MKVGLSFFIGLLLFSAGLHGNLGSILAALIDPGALTPGPQPGTSGSGFSDPVLAACDAKAQAQGLLPGSQQYAIFMGQCQTKANQQTCDSLAKAKGLTGAAYASFMIQCLANNGKAPGS